VEGSEETMRMRTLWADEDFAGTMGIAIASGRSFSKEFPSDREHAVMLNETAIRQLGWAPEEAIGKRVILSQFDSVYKQVIGVVGDYHFISLKEKIEPLIISYATRGRLAVKLSGGNIKSAVEDVEKIWNDFGSGFPMEWSFLDETVNRLYKKEIVQSRLFSLFSAISVVIACLGILGLTSYMAMQRKKEIGIRKILGASAEQLSLLLMKDMMLLVLISNLIAIPVGYWAMRQWLEGFAYKTPIQPLVFLYGALLVFGVAALIAGLRAMKTATENPVNALRSE
jgi:putative ABC transport system permease protein